jgi:hypothetical protein
MVLHFVDNATKRIVTHLARDFRVLAQPGRARRALQIAAVVNIDLQDRGEGGHHGLPKDRIAKIENEIGELVRGQLASQSTSESDFDQEAHISAAASENFHLRSPGVSRSVLNARQRVAVTP